MKRATIAVSLTGTSASTGPAMSIARLISGFPSAKPLAIPRSVRLPSRSCSPTLVKSRARSLEIGGERRTTDLSSEQATHHEKPPIKRLFHHGSAHGCKKEVDLRDFRA